MSALRTILVAAPLLLLLAASADEPRAILPDGSRKQVSMKDLASLGDTSWPGWIALDLPASRDPLVRQDSVMAMQDGQRVRGQFEPVSQGLRWRSAAIGSVRVDLEHVAWIGEPEMCSNRSMTRDEVHFLNGDRLEGFVQSIDSDRGIRIEVSGGEGATERSMVDHDLSRVAAVRFASRPEPATGWRFWLQDGSMIDADSWSAQGDRVVIRGMHLPSAPPSAAVPWNQITGIRRAPGGLVALAELPWSSSDVPGSPRLAPACVSVPAGFHALGLAPLDLHGPGMFEAALPDGPFILDGELTVPPGLASSVDCTVVLLDGARELLRTRLKAPTQPVPVHAELSSGRLVVRIEDSARGAYGAAARMSGSLLLPKVIGSPGSSDRPEAAPANTPVPAAQ